MYYNVDAPGISPIEFHVISQSSRVTINCILNRFIIFKHRQISNRKDLGNERILMR